MVSIGDNFVEVTMYKEGLKNEFTNKKNIR